MHTSISDIAIEDFDFDFLFALSNKHIPEQHRPSAIEFHFIREKANILTKSPTHGNSHQNYLQVRGKKYIFDLEVNCPVKW